MKFDSVRFVAKDIKAMVAFYETILEKSASWYGETYAEIVTTGGMVAFSTMEVVNMFKEGIAEPASNRSVIVEWSVEDVDATYSRLKDNAEVVFEPMTLPWGDRHFQIRDPEGSAVGFFSPVTDEAKARFASR